MSGKALRKLHSEHDDHQQYSDTPDSISGDELLSELEALASKLKIDSSAGQRDETPEESTVSEPAVSPDKDLRLDQGNNVREKKVDRKVDKSDGVKTSEPGKLPEHLRAKRAATSQDAAAKALEDLFN